MNPWSEQAGKLEYLFLSLSLDDSMSTVSGETNGGRGGAGYTVI